VTAAAGLVLTHFITNFRRGIWRRTPYLASSEFVGFDFSLGFKPSADQVLLSQTIT
jgi:hypothetical protein